jgi:DNA-binding MarR family transcriptional regulator
MSIKDEMKLNRDFGMRGEETMVNIIYTTETWKKLSNAIYKQFDITPAQYNVLSLIYWQSEPGVGLTQAEISEMMLVKPANTTPLVDRMEKLELVKRSPVPEDRRYWRVSLLPKGEKTFKAAHKIWFERIQHVLGPLSDEELDVITKLMEGIRSRTNSFEAKG